MSGRTPTARPWLWCSLMLAPAAMAAGVDATPWTWDPALYGDVSLRLANAAAVDPADWVGQMIGGLRAQAPMLAWLGQLAGPLGPWMGGAERALLLIPLFATVLTARIAWVIGGDMGRGRLRIGMLGALVVGCSPLAQGLARRFYVEPLQMLVVAWVLRIAQRAPDRSRPATQIDLVAALSVGLLVKATTPLYVLFPTMLALWAARRAQPREAGDPLVWRAAVPAGIAVSWYLANGATVIRHLWSHSLGAAGLEYGPSVGVVQGVGFWSTELARSFLHPVTGALLLCALALATRGRTLKRGSPDRYLDQLVLAVLGNMVLVGLILALQHNREPRFLLAFAPGLALMMSWSMRCVWRVLPSVLACVVFVGQGVWVQAQTFGFGGYDPNLSHWVAPVAVGSPERGWLDEISRVSCPVASLGRPAGVVWVVADEPWLNRNTLSLAFASSGRVGCSTRWLGPVQGLDSRDMPDAGLGREALTWVLAPRPLAQGADAGADDPSDPIVALARALDDRGYDEIMLSESVPAMVLARWMVVEEAGGGE